MKRGLSTALLVLVLGGLAPMAEAVMEMSDSERDVLPEVCRHQRYVSLRHLLPPSPFWATYLGTTYEHVHHYCWAVVHLNRTYQPGVTPLLKKSWLGSAINDIDYVFKNSPPFSPMHAEIYTVRGKIFIRLGDMLNAKKSFEKALELDPNYWRAYFYWADALVYRGNTKEAEGLILEGLKRAPTAKPLLDLAKDLHIKVPPPKVGNAGDDANLIVDPTVAVPELTPADGARP